MQAFPERPPGPQDGRGLRARLGEWFAVLFLTPMLIWGFLSGAFTGGQPLPQRERQQVCLALALLATLLLCACLGPLILIGFLALSALDTPTTPGAEIAFALLYTLFGLLLLLGLHRVQGGVLPNPPRHGLALLFSSNSSLFWMGAALCGIVAAQLALPAYSRWLSILFWTVAGIIALFPLVGFAFNLLRRRLRRHGVAH